MPSAVKVEEHAKELLEEIQAEIRLETGRQATQQEILTRMIERSNEQRREFVDSFRESTVPLTESEKALMQSGRFSGDHETDEADLDRILYG